MKKETRKFKLIVEKRSEKEETLVNISKDGLFKTSAELFEIDLFLLCGLNKGFKTKEHLLETLIKMGENVSLDDEVRVKYFNKGEKSFKPLFGYHPEINLLAYLSSERRNQVEELKKLKNKEEIKAKKENIKQKFNDQFIIKEINAGFFEAVKDFKYINILIKRNFLNGYIQDMGTYERIKETYNEDQAYSKRLATNKLEAMLRNYKNLRMVILSLKEYNQLYDKNLGVDPRYAEAELMKICESFNVEEDFYDKFKKAPDMIRMEPEVNPFDIYAMDELEEILSNDDYDDYKEEYDKTNSYQNIIK